MKSALLNSYINLRSKGRLILDNLFGTRNYRKFIIISDSRTGSTLLKNLLNFHNQIIAEGEIFKIVDPGSSEKVWNTIFRPRPEKIKYVGFKLFYFHPSVGDKKVWSFLKADTKTIIIHLVRKNILRSLVSKKIGLKTRMWTENINSTNSIPLEQKRILLDPIECEKYFEEIIGYQKKIMEEYNHHQVITVEYEDLQEDRTKVLEKIQGSWGLEPFMKDSELKKQNPETLQELIINYDDFKQNFLGSKWEYLFHLD